MSPMIRLVKVNINYIGPAVSSVFEALISTTEKDFLRLLQRATNFIKAAAGEMDVICKELEKS